MNVSISGRSIGLDFPPFVIAEMSGNHNQNLDRALAIVDSAARAGAHALKLQTYTADTITLNVRGGDFEIADPESLLSGKNLHDLYQQAHTPWEWHAPIMQRSAANLCGCLVHCACSVALLQYTLVLSLLVGQFWGLAKGKHIVSKKITSRKNVSKLISDRTRYVKLGCISINSTRGRGQIMELLFVL